MAVAVIMRGKYTKTAPCKGVSRPLFLPHVNILFDVSLKNVGLNFITKSQERDPKGLRGWLERTEFVMPHPAVRHFLVQWFLSLLGLSLSTPETTSLEMPMRCHGALGLVLGTQLLPPPPALI